MRGLKTLAKLKEEYHYKILVSTSEASAMRAEFLKSQDNITLNSEPCYHIGREAEPIIISCRYSPEMRVLIRLPKQESLFRPRRVAVKLFASYAKEWWMNKDFYQMLGIDAIKLLHYCAEKNHLAICGIQDLNAIHYIDIEKLPEKDPDLEKVIALKSTFGHDNMTKYECTSCHGQFILGDHATKMLAGNAPMCSYCGSKLIEWCSKVMHDEIAEMGDMAIHSDLEKI